MGRVEYIHGGVAWNVAGYISKRLNMLPVASLLEEKGDEIFSKAKSVVPEVDLDKEIVKLTLEMAEKYGVKVFCVVSNMSIAAQRQAYLNEFYE